jgi:hypothetical protein
LEAKDWRMTGTAFPNLDSRSSTGSIPAHPTALTVNKSRAIPGKIFLFNLPPQIDFLEASFYHATGRERDDFLKEIGGKVTSVQLEIEP